MKTYTESTLLKKAPEELRQLLREQYDIDIPDDDPMTRKELVAMVLQQQEARIYMQAEDRAAAGDADERDESEGFRSDPRSWEQDRVLVRFFETAGPEGKQPIDCALNGRAYRIRRNTPVAIPRAVLRMLNDCVIDEHHQRIDGGTVEHAESHVLRFPYQIIQDPAPAESW